MELSEFNVTLPTLFYIKRRYLLITKFNSYFVIPEIKNMILFTNNVQKNGKEY